MHRAGMQTSAGDVSSNRHSSSANFMATLPMSTTPQEHKADAPQSIRCAVITVSDTRTFETDAGGQAVVDHLLAAGHQIVFRDIIPDEPAQMRPLLEALRARDDVDAVLLTGGTGISSRDQTYETVASLISRPLPGYGELLRMLSYEQIGSATMLSRATGGLMGRTLLLTMPGSRAAVQLAMEKIIVPELPHLIREARR
jgi:molybdenum cofactor biosynthesis protein B